MRILTLAACLLLGSAAFASQAADVAAPAAASSKPAKVEIRIIGGGWGDADPADIEAVLRSVAAVMLEHFPGRELQPILVAHSDEHPYTLFEKGPAGEYRIFLAAKDMRWARFAYEFAHELSHVLANYEHYQSAASAAHNQWFEEALCEVASIYALKRLAHVWRTSPPFPHWAEFAPNFERYAEDLVLQSHRQLPAEMPLAEWFRRHEDDLSLNPYLRRLNEIVANVLLPIFERAPDFWRSIGFLQPPAGGGRFDKYLRTWHVNAPDDYKPAISHVMALFGIAGDATADAPQPFATMEEIRVRPDQLSHAEPAAENAR